MKSTEYIRLRSYLGFVDEFGQRDIIFMSEHMDSLECAAATVHELETEEFTVFGRSTSAKLNNESRSVVGYGKSFNNLKHFSRWRMLLTYSLKFRMLFRDIKHTQQRDDGVVCSFEKHELQWVVVERNTLENSRDERKHRTSRNYVWS